VTVLLEPVVPQASSRECSSRAPVVLSASEAALAAILYRTAAALAREGGPAATEVESLAMLLMYEVGNSGQDAMTDDGTPVRRAWTAIRPVLDHIERQIDTRLPLEELASIANLSLSQTARVARAFLGTSLHRYVLSRRIARACDLLANTVLPVSEIAALTGLSSQSHLTSLLSDNVGHSPASYRRSLQPRPAEPA
jgi:AraC family transcriptional regulator